MSQQTRSISKRTRFEIFKRDSFRCQYCGETSETVKLVVDHVIPVCKGGTGEPENLVTSCEPCNQGKAGKLLEHAPISEDRRLELLQESRERQEAADASRRVAALRKEEFQSLVNSWGELFERETVNTATIKIIFSYVEKHGFQEVWEWMTIAEMRLGPGKSDQTYGRYISGIRKKKIEEELE